MNLLDLKKRLAGFAALVVLLVSMPGIASAQAKGSAEGVVKDSATEMPLAGALVQIKDTTNGSVANVEGEFSIPATRGDVLVFSMLGYLPLEITYNGQTGIEAMLSEDVARIEDVVVIGYQSTTRKEVTGSVSSVREGEFNPGSYSNVAGLLQGKVAGLTITNSDGGDPNGGFSMQLRGLNTFSAGMEPLVIIDGVLGGDLRDVNPADVESFDVLKDGSAAAIYGTRGTNGVVIITTKRAKKGTQSVEYDGQVNVQTVARRAMPMTADEFRYAIENFYPASSGSIGTADTDWFDAITRTPISHKHNLSVSGGSETFSHRTVLGVELNQGLQRKNDSDKYMFRTNIAQKALKGWLDLDYNAYFTKRKYSTSNQDAFRQAFLHNPTEPIYDTSNEATGGYSFTPGMDYHNPVAMIDEHDNASENDSFGASVRATLNILPVSGLKWDNFISYRQSRFESRDYRTNYYPSLMGQGGKAEITNSYDNSIQWESTLNYSASFGHHSLQVLAGYSFEQGMYQTSFMENGGFDNDITGTDNIGAGSGLLNGQMPDGISSFKEGNRYVGIFGRVMYNYDEKYLASVSLRYDGSSRFGANRKWGLFPAVSVGWRINREGFLQDVHWVDELKLRAGFGMTGNQDFDNYRSLVLMVPKGYYYSNGKWLPAYYPANNPNPELRWEKKSEFNVGVDFSLLGGRLSGAVDYYNRLTSDLVYDYTVPQPPYVFDELYANVGAVRNEGVELMLSGIPVRTKDFLWQTTMTISHNTNKLVKFADERFKGTMYEDSWLNTPMGVNCQRLIEGESVGTFYAPVWAGVAEDGTDKLEGSIAGNVAPEAYRKTGTAYPDAVIGWSNTLTWKNIDLGFMLRASIGGYAFNQYRANYENINFIGLRNILGSWLDNTEFTGQPRYSTKYIEDATYLKMDNISIGYNFNLEDKFISRMRISFTAQNVFCITGYTGVDPEVNISGLAPGIEGMSYYPRTRMFTLGLNMVF